MIFKDEKCNTFFQYLGLLVFGYTVIKTSLRLFNNIGTFFLGIGSVNLKKYGSWAVVTGCTDGIGKAYAEKLAKLGLNLVLISRTEEKLRNQANELKEKYSIETKIIAADFTEQSSIYSHIKQELNGLDIGVLVNNVGVSYSHPEFFDVFGQNEKTVSDMINCNITSVTKMSAIVLPGMVEKRKGVIINNASASGRIPCPLLTVYSASKAYVDFFSRALNQEYKTKGIIVQSLCPYFVSTKLSAMKKSFQAPSPNEYVSNALATIGSQSVTNGCLLHNLQGWLYEDVIPGSLFEKIQLNMMLGTRARALKKAKRLQEQQNQKKD
ncbi:unnamed protein product [Brachionus calyciflorus]|uniref:Uncharacterized protein n=1 Tax=Brachionus calyciflorus TaxID=104777 RepID=A0A813NQK2_9BILA|nr:unnamed protein product [Brachionus calyciflorus]